MIVVKANQKHLGGSGVDLGSGSSVGLRAPKRRKTRTTFTSFQLAELEVYFSKQKYLTPADRDQIAGELGLSSTQVSSLVYTAIRLSEATKLAWAK